MLSVEPILDLMFLKSGMGWLMTRSCLDAVAGDLGGVRMMATFFSCESRLRDLGVPGVCGVPGVRQDVLGGVPGVMAVEPGVRGVEVPERAERERTDSMPTCQTETHSRTAIFRMMFRFKQQNHRSCMFTAFSTL